MTELSHKEWLEKEYSEWIKALQESTVHNFKEHPGVKRMLGEIDRNVFFDHIKGWSGNNMTVVNHVVKIDLIGFDKEAPTLMPTGNCFRFIYYAQQILKRNPSSICEIGGGVGQFFAILLALGYQGDYYIEDLPEVKRFQREYLHEVCKQTGIQTYETTGKKFDTIVSFYALGEFDAATRQQYEQLIDETPHGYIAWNPHSGASDSLSIFENHDIKITPGIEPGISIIEW